MSSKIVKVFHISPKEDFSGVARDHVATVTWNLPGDDMTALEYAYRWTQNLQDSWSIKDMEHWDNNADVVVERPLHVRDGRTYGLRSSMVGDEFEVDGVLYRCASCGFEKV